MLSATWRELNLPFYLFMLMHRSAKIRLYEKLNGVQVTSSTHDHQIHRNKGPPFICLSYVLGLVRQQQWQTHLMLSHSLRRHYMWAAKSPDERIFQRMSAHKTLQRRSDLKHATPFYTSLRGYFDRLLFPRHVPRRITTMNRVDSIIQSSPKQKTK